MGQPTCLFVPPDFQPGDERVAGSVRDVETAGLALNLDPQRGRRQGDGVAQDGRQRTWLRFEHRGVAEIGLGGLATKRGQANNLIVDGFDGQETVGTTEGQSLGEGGNIEDVAERPARRRSVGEHSGCKPGERLR